MNLLKASFYEKRQERDSRKVAFGIGFGSRQALCIFYPTMKKVYTLLFFIAAQVQIAAQAPGFNFRTTCEFTNTKLYKICIDNDTIVGLGTSEDSTGVVNGIVMMKFDSLGNLLHAKHLQDSLIGPNPFYIRYGSFMKTSDNGYIFNVNTLSSYYPLVIKTDHFFNPVFIKKYEVANYYAYSYCGLEPLSDGFLLHGTLTRSDNSKDDGFVRKISLEGEPVWLTVIGNTNSDEVLHDLAVKNDSTYVVGFIGVSNQSDVYSSLKVLDVNGVVAQDWNSEPESEIGYLQKIIKADDTGYLTYGLYVTELLPPNNSVKIVKSTFAKLDLDFNIKHLKRYGREVWIGSEIMFYDFEETIDGNYIAAGRTSMALPDNGPSFARGWLMKFSHEGDSIWSRQDTSDVMPISYNNRQRLGGVGVLSSGSIVAGGYVTRAEDNSSYIWLIKTTNDGCIDTLYCGLVSGTEEVPHVADVQQVIVYPNPASEVVHIQVPDISGKASMEINVFDLSGQQRKVIFADTEGDLTLPVSDLPSGIYFISIKLPDGRVQYGKVCVAH
ncbi:MAG: T9SS type A sorting domain-containing protein [Saprospiraceae bacterium]|nr:T9SS type A sorting domain-containing protein [Saprospiraceae bacterium]